MVLCLPHRLSGLASCISKKLCNKANVVDRQSSPAFRTDLQMCNNWVSSGTREGGGEFGSRGYLVKGEFCLELDRGGDERGGVGEWDLQTDSFRRK